MSGANTPGAPPLPMNITAAPPTSPPPPIGDASRGLPFQPNEYLPNNNNFITIEGIGAVPIAPAPITDAVRLNNSASAGNDNANNSLGLGITLMQSSPPPHSYRHSRAYRHFKNPPQPHMCIRTTTDVGEELFINVLSWTRIVIPQEPSDPIPLYGGMRVPPGSPRSPPIVFAVMANPEVLKDSGRHSKDPEERRAMVELMCDFVEAMNPGVKLVRNAVILKDRDISGELKDVWNAVQAQRDREREEQIMQQRQQQHYHNVTTQQMFPKSGGVAGSKVTGATTQKPSENETTSEKVENGTGAGTTTSAATAVQTLAQQLDNKASAAATEGAGDNNNCVNRNGLSGGCANALNGEVLILPASTAANGPSGQSEIKQPQQNGSCDQTDAATNAKEKNSKSAKEDAKVTASNANSKDNTQQQQTATNNSNNITKTTPTSPTATSTSSAATSTSTVSSITTPVAAAPLPAPAPAPTKKEKLGGFLPNGCIFPRFKNNKNKDKDKDKDSSKPKEKEKTLLNALKKSKDKKVAPLEHHAPEKNTTVAEADTKTQYEKNCINLESEVEKLDLNKIDTSTNNDNMFIKLKVAATSAAAAATAK